MDFRIVGLPAAPFRRFFAMPEDELAGHRAVRRIVAASETFDRVNEVPQALSSRLLSVRAFDAQHMMVGCDIAEGEALPALIERLFGNERAEYLHVHFARAGCYAARVERTVISRLFPCPKMASAAGLSGT